MKLGLGGYYKLAAVNADTGETRELTDWFPNLITDAGLERIANGACYNTAYVGSDQTTPNVNNTTLGAPVASTNTVMTTNRGAQSVAPWYGWHRRTWRFPMGAAAGNLSEVGVGWPPSNVFSRSLILDTNGDPTTITVLPNEFLDVTYELRLYPPTEDEVAQIVIDGVLHDCVIRAAGVASSDMWTPFVGDFGFLFAYTGVASSAITLYQGNIGSITGTPTGTQSNSAQASYHPYSAGSHTRTAFATYGLDSANFGGVGAMLFYSTLGTYQISFDPKIVKDNTRTLRLDFGLSWARR